MSYRQISLHTGFTNLYSHKQCMRTALHLHQCSVLCFLTLFCHGISKLLVFISLLWIIFIIISKIKSHLNLFSKFIYFVHFSIGLFLNDWDISLLWFEYYVLYFFLIFDLLMELIMTLCFLIFISSNLLVLNGILSCMSR